MLKTGTLDVADWTAERAHAALQGLFMAQSKVILVISFSVRPGDQFTFNG